MSGPAEGSRLTELRALLDREGLAVPARVAGADGEIAAIGSGPELRDRLAGLAPAIRSLGFRYVAIEPPGTTENEAS